MARPTRVLLGAAVLALALLPPAALAQDRTFKGKQCTVKTDAPVVVGKAIASRIDRYCQVFEDYYDGFQLKRKNDNKIIARVFDTYDDFAEFHRRNSGLTRTPAAFFSPSMNAIVLYNDEGDVYLRQTVFHECSHNFLNRYTYDAPRWFNEGFAEFFEGWRMTPEGDLLEIRPHLYDLILMQDALQESRALTLFELLSMEDETFADFEKHHPELDSYLHYAMSWSLVYYCLEGPDAGDRDRMTRFIQHLNAEGATAEFEVDDWDALQERWEAYVLGLDPERRSAADHMLVGAGYQNSRRWTQAMAEYSAALELDPDSHGALYWLGYCTKRSGAYDEATALLARAAEADPEDPRAPYQLARIVLGIDRAGSPADPERAIELVEEALDRAGGRSPVYLLLLARAQDKAGDPGAAVRTTRTILTSIDKDDERQRRAYEGWLDEFKANERAAKKRR